MRSRSFVAVALMGLAIAQMAFACPTCGNSIEHSGGNLAEGFFFSILFMMSMPFVVVGGLALLCWLEIRKARRAATLAATSEGGRPAANATP